MWFLAFEHDDRIPVLTYVNLGIHELGHMLTYSWSEVVTAMMGSIAQVAVPVLVAAYFFFRRGDWVAAGVCLAWAAASAVEVSLYVADAPTEKLDLIGGGRHDWAFILGPEGYDAMEKSASLARTIRDGASVAAAVGFIICLLAPLRGRRRPQPEGSALSPSGSAPGTVATWSATSKSR
jgi:hypothetical protein